jgi:hypothetical protein
MDAVGMIMVAMRKRAVAVARVFGGGGAAAAARRMREELETLRIKTLQPALDTTMQTRIQPCKY